MKMDIKTNEDLFNKLLFEAFQAGNYRVNGEHPKESAHQRFNEWFENEKIIDKIYTVIDQYY